MSLELLGYDYLDVIAISSVDLSTAVFIDTETTGLDPDKDEVLSLAVVNANGRELFYSLLLPQRRKRWPNAQKIHGITWQDVKDQKTLIEWTSDLDEIFCSASAVIGYNVEFDLNMLKSSGYNVLNRCRRYIDLMEPFSNAHGKRWSEKYDRYLFEKLSSCAKHYGFKFKAHNALEDARATAFCFIEFQKECVERLPEAEKEKREREENSRRIEALMNGQASDKKGAPKWLLFAVAAALLLILFSCSAANP